MIPGHEALGLRAVVDLLHAGSHALANTPPDLRGAVAIAMTAAFHDVFRFGAALAVAALLTVLFLTEIPLRTTPAQMTGGEGG